MTGFDSKRKIAMDKLDDDDIQVYAQPEQEPVDNDFFKSLAKKNQSPDQRPWVGLTDEEMDEWTPEIHGVIRSIEAALRSKNT